MPSVAFVAQYSPLACMIDADRGRGMANDKIFVQASVPATLNNGTGGLTDYQTIFEAVMSWHRLPSGQKNLATVEVLGGPIYHSHQIECLYMGPSSPGPGEGRRFAKSRSNSN
jgi:hypothetical protein